MKEEEEGTIISVFVPLILQGLLGLTTRFENQMTRYPKEAPYNILIVILSIKLRFKDVFIFTNYLLHSYF
jgi:hypothetical protein